MFLASPAWLLALAALAVPIVLHRIRRGRLRAVRVGSVRLIPGDRTPRGRRFPPGRRLLLAVRCALLAAVALALAGPRAWTARPQAAGPAGDWALASPDLLAARPALGAAGGAAFARLDALVAGGATLRLLAPGLPAAAAPAARSGDPWSLLREADDLAPPGVRFHLFTLDRLDDLRGPRPRLARPVEWTAVAAPEPNRWIERAGPDAGTPVTIGVSGPERTTFERAGGAVRWGDGEVRLAPGGFVAGDDRIGVAAAAAPIAAFLLSAPERADDAAYVRAALAAAAEASGLPVAVAAPTEPPRAFDIAFWLSPDLVPPALLGALASGGVLVSDAAGDGVACATSAVLRDLAASIRLRRCAAGPEGQGGATLWTDGFGRPLLEAEAVGAGRWYRLRGRFHPVWSDLPLDPVAPLRGDAGGAGGRDAVGRRVRPAAARGRGRRRGAVVPAVRPLPPGLVRPAARSRAAGVDRRGRRGSGAARPGALRGAARVRPARRRPGAAPALAGGARGLAAAAVAGAGAGDLAAAGGARGRRALARREGAVIPALLTRLRARGRLVQRSAGLLRAGAAGLPLLALASAAPAPGARAALALLGAVAMAAAAAPALRRARRIDLETIARHLDRTVPEMDDSAGLLLAPRRMSALEELQRRRLLARIDGLDERSLLPRRPVAAAAAWLAGSGLASALILGLAARLPAGAGMPPSTQAGGDRPALLSIAVEIEPPAYTGVAPSRVDRLDLSAPEGSRLALRIEAAGDPDAAALILDGERVPLEPAGAGAFRGERRLDATRLGWLRLERGGREILRSDYARLEAIPDRAPSLRVVQPEPLLRIDPAEVAPLPVEVEAADDYGLRGAAIVATLALGSGDRVEFRERRLEFPGPVGGGRARLARTLDLAALGVGAGSELYLHVEVTDNRDPEPNLARTPTLRVVVPGGPGPSLDLGPGLPVLEPPGFLRSQRQIILDTERLIAEGAGIPRDRFDYRSQILGDDQSALRMRYGALLGEESEDGRPIETEDEDSAGIFAGDEPDVPAAIAAVPGELTHEHDSEESASFFSDPVRRALRAMLTQMWRAETLLRTNRPEEALPHEREALRLLKGVQEASRVYAQKVGFEPPPLRPEEDRLRGDLSEIDDQRVLGRDSDAPQAAAVRRALAAVRALRAGGAPRDLSASLAPVQEALERRARDDPSIDLRALNLIGRLRAGAPPEAGTAEIDALESALWTMLPEPEPRPGAGAGGTGSLYQRYRRLLEGGP